MNNCKQCCSGWNSPRTITMFDTRLRSAAKIQRMNNEHKMHIRQSCKNKKAALKTSVSSIKASHLIINRQHQRSLLWNIIRKHKRHSSSLQIHINLHSLLLSLTTATLDHKRSTRKAQLLGMHDNFLPGHIVGGGHFNGGDAREGVVGEVGCEVEIVAGWVNGGWKEDSACGFVGSGGRHGVYRRRWVCSSSRRFGSTNPLLRSHF